MMHSTAHANASPQPGALALGWSRVAHARDGRLKAAKFAEAEVQRTVRIPLALLKLVTARILLALGVVFGVRGAHCFKTVRQSINQRRCV